MANTSFIAFRCPDELIEKVDSVRGRNRTEVMIDALRQYFISFGEKLESSEERIIRAKESIIHELKKIDGPLDEAGLIRALRIEGFKVRDIERAIISCFNQALIVRSRDGGVNLTRLGRGYV